MVVPPANNFEQQQVEPVWGCVLIGGKSSRMGQPKHLIEINGRAWLELIVEKLREKVEHIVISGQGEIPESLQDIPIVEDVEGVRGPLAGIVSILRKHPGISWIVTACDMPYMETAALDWLLGQRGPGVKAILPDLNGEGHVEPLLAYYSNECLGLLEKLAADGSMRPGALVGEHGVVTPLVPDGLHLAWKNVNFPEDLIC